LSVADANTDMDTAIHSDAKQIHTTYFEKPLENLEGEEI
jgi:hypothetical protein